jgi:glycosyltransferase involved in cell wall biosynthesis
MMLSNFAKFFHTHLDFRYGYWKTLVRYYRGIICLTKVSSSTYDIVFVSPEAGWILDGICKEIDKYYQGKTKFIYSANSLPYAKAYFFAHYSLLKSAIINNPHIISSKKLVWYTHVRDVGYSTDELIYFLNKSTKVLATNSSNEKLLLSMGLKSKKVMTLLGGADPDLFTAIKHRNQEKRKCVGFCLGFRGHDHYRERKNYDLIIALVKKLHEEFEVLILGKNWEEYERFEEMATLPHFLYVEAPYSEYPKLYQQMDIFISASKLEGGPIPLIEAMMCNVFPVVSNTGFAPDIIRDGENGFLFDVDASVETIYELVQQAMKMNVNVIKTVEHLTLENFSLEVQKAMFSV